MLMFLQIFIFSFLVCILKGQGPNLEIINKQILPLDGESTILSNGTLTNSYNHSTFNQVLTCTNGGLQILNNTVNNSLLISYEGMVLTYTNVHITVSPNQFPKPNITKFDIINATNMMEISFNCPSHPDNQNYYNKVTVQLPSDYQFSFLLNCDPKGRHKKFQYGYLIITIINAAITIGVAMQSHIWSLRMNQKLVQVQLKWFHFLFFSLIILVIVGFFYLFASNDFMIAFVSLRYFGIFVSIFFLFVCFNQILFLMPFLRKQFFKSLRRCQATSIFLTLGITILACFVQNWIFYDAIAICVCIGSIKLFKFRSLKQAFASKIIIVITITAVAIASHWLLTQSYNDYARELSSPLFIQVPDLIDNLYKKCSWLPVIDIIVPGLALSFLRMYDFNKGSKWFGVYTIAGNITFIIATILWIVLQALYPFSVPFSLVTYLPLILVIALISFSRNEWTILYLGLFEQQRQNFNSQALQQQRKSFSALVEKGMLDPLMRDSISDHGSNIMET